MADILSTPENDVSKDGQEHREIEGKNAMQGEQQKEFIIRVGIVKDGKLSMPYWVELTNDKWNLFLSHYFEDILSGHLKEGEDVTEGIEVNVYDKGGHEFEMMLKKWVKYSSPYYVLNRGWFSFWNQQGLKEDDFIIIRTFRHAITNKLSFAVT